MVYHGYQDIGVAVSTEDGLVVPVLRDADFMIADVNGDRDFGLKARDKLTIEEMTGGTFTVSNGGVFGSLLSTPILNPPQTGILGIRYQRTACGNRRSGGDSSDDVPGVL